jgi:hypothetical protein
LIYHHRDLLDGGRGIRQDIPRAIQYFLSDADHPVRGYAFGRTPHRPKPADGVPEETYAMCELVQYADDGAKPAIEWVATWAQQSAEQRQFLAMIEWADILGNGVGFAADLAEAWNMLAWALSAEFQTGQNNLRMTNSRSARASDAPIKSQNKR